MHVVVQTHGGTAAAKGTRTSKSPTGWIARTWSPAIHSPPATASALWPGLSRPRTTAKISNSWTTKRRRPATTGTSSSTRWSKIATLSRLDDRACRPRWPEKSLTLQAAGDDAVLPLVLHGGRGREQQRDPAEGDQAAVLLVLEASSRRAASGCVVCRELSIMGACIVCTFHALSTTSSRSSLGCK